MVYLRSLSGHNNNEKINTMFTQENNKDMTLNNVRNFHTNKKDKKKLQQKKNIKLKSNLIRQTFSA